MKNILLVIVTIFYNVIVQSKCPLEDVIAPCKCIKESKENVSYFILVNI